MFAEMQLYFENANIYVYLKQACNRFVFIFTIDSW